MVIVPIGDGLEDLLKRDVVKSGDGLSLGLSQHMMKFFTMEGPFVGLYYAAIDMLSICVCVCVCVCIVQVIMQAIYKCVMKEFMYLKVTFLAGTNI